MGDPVWKLAVIVPTLNQFELAYKALASVKFDGLWQPFIIPNWQDNIGVSKAWIS